MYKTSQNFNKYILSQIKADRAPDVVFADVAKAMEAWNKVQ